MEGSVSVFAAKMGKTFCITRFPRELGDVCFIDEIGEINSVEARHRITEVEIKTRESGSVRVEGEVLFVPFESFFRVIVDDKAVMVDILGILGGTFLHFRIACVPMTD